MSREDYLDPLYRECLPTRPTPSDGCLDGPTARWMLHELTAVIGDDDSPTLAVA